MSTQNFIGLKKHFKDRVISIFGTMIKVDLIQSQFSSNLFLQLKSNSSPPDNCWQSTGIKVKENSIILTLHNLSLKYLQKQKTEHPMNSRHV